MKSILITVAALLSIAPGAQAARQGSDQVMCSYIFASTLKSNSGIRIIPTEHKGDLVLKGENGKYQTEHQIDDMNKVIMEVTVNEQMSISVKVIETRSNFGNPKVLVSTTSLHEANASGEFIGSNIIRNPDVESLALRDRIDFEAAATSEKLPTGHNFVGAFLNCQ